MLLPPTRVARRPPTPGGILLALFRHPERLCWSQDRETNVTLQQATELAQKQADEFSVVMIVVKDDLSEDPGGYECCAEMYRTTLYPDHNKEFWEIVETVMPR